MLSQVPVSLCFFVFVFDVEYEFEAPGKDPTSAF